MSAITPRLDCLPPAQRKLWPELAVIGNADNAVSAASLLDLAAQKMKVVIQRAEMKDYLDVHTLLRAGITLEAALGAARALYPQFNPVLSLKALSYFGDLPKLPENIRRELTAAIASVRQIPEIAIRSTEFLGESKSKACPGNADRA